MGGWNWAERYGAIAPPPSGSAHSGVSLPGGCGEVATPRDLWAEPPRNRGLAGGAGDGAGGGDARMNEDTGRTERARLAAREVFDQYRPTGQIAGYKGAMYQKLYAACEAYVRALAPEPNSSTDECANCGHFRALHMPACVDGEGVVPCHCRAFVAAERAPEPSGATTEVEQIARITLEEAGREYATDGSSIDDRIIARVKARFSGGTESDLERWAWMFRNNVSLVYYPARSAFIGGSWHVLPSKSDDRGITVCMGSGPTPDSAIDEAMRRQERYK